MKIIKRNGSEENLTKKKIFDSIVKANDCVPEDEKLTKKQIQRITDAVAEACEQFEEPVHIDLIEDMIEKKLMEHSAYEVAKRYISYRYEKERVRKNKNLAEKLFAKNVVNQNANVDEFSFGGRIGEAASYVMKEYALNHLISPMAKANHINNEIYIHDLDHYAIGDHNCLSVPLDDLLAKGFNTRQTDIRPANSINTAMQLVAVIFQVQSLNQFGGVAATHLDWTMVPYVRKSFRKHWLDGRKYISGDPFGDIIGTKAEDMSIDHGFYKTNEKIYKYAMDKTEEELKQAVEGMYHNLNSLQSRSGCQLPFTSINYGTCTSTEGRMVTKALLEGSIKGVGKFHKTSIFPCGIFQCMKGVNRAPGDPNYDLFRLALKSTAQRLYPNFVNVDWSTNAGYDRNDPRTYTSTMGCVDGSEVVIYKNNGRLIVNSFNRFWDEMAFKFEVKSQSELGYSSGEYIDLDEISIFDHDKFVSCHRIIRNPDKGDWTKVVLTNGRTLMCTMDHPWSVVGKDGEVKTLDLKLGDEIVLDDDYQFDIEAKDEVSIEEAWLDGFVLCDGCYDHQFMSTVGCDEYDIVDKYVDCVKKAIGEDVVIREQHRGEKGDYVELKVPGTDVGKVARKRFFRIFDGLQKVNRKLPEYVFQSSKNVRLSFLAGMIDADGYINDSGSNSIVQIGSTNKVISIQTMILAQSLGLPAKIYENHYNSKNKEKIRYRVEFAAVRELIPFLSSLKKIDKIRNSTVLRFETGKVKEISLIGNRNSFSYDVSTESEHFSVSGIRSHNCRTYNGFDINGFGQMKDGRGNICPVSIVTPTLAMEAKESVTDELNRDKERGLEWEEGAFEETCIEKFMKLLDKKIGEAKDMLLERFDWICSQPAKSARFMYENGTMFGYVPEEGIRSALKHGTLAIGQIALAETLQLLIGCDHTEPKGMELAKRIEQLFKDRCAEFKKKYKLNFGVYYTPAENLCHTALKKFVEKYGVIENVSDKEFFTNSIHVPVWRKMSPFEKIDIEAQLTGYSNAGCITYVELDSGAKNNIDALETMVNYAMDKDIPYFAINVPSDTCLKCGYQDEINDKCPECGSEDIQRLRRVTGYLTGDYVTAFNKGKQDEVERRVKHSECLKDWKK